MPRRNLAAAPRLPTTCFRRILLEGDSCTFETLCRRFAINDPIVSQIAEMVHDADLEDDKFDRKEAVGIDLMLKGLAQMGKSSDEILSAGIAAMRRYLTPLKAGSHERDNNEDHCAFTQGNFLPKP